MKQKLVIIIAFLLVNTLHADEIIIKTNKESYKLGENVYITVNLMLTRFAKNHRQVKEPVIKTFGLMIYHRTRFKKVKDKLYSIRYKAKVLLNHAYFECYSYSHKGRFGNSVKIRLIE